MTQDHIQRPTFEPLSRAELAALGIKKCWYIPSKVEKMLAPSNLSESRSSVVS